MLLELPPELTHLVLESFCDARALATASSCSRAARDAADAALRRKAALRVCAQGLLWAMARAAPEPRLRTLVCRDLRPEDVSVSMRDVLEAFPLLEVVDVTGAQALLSGPGGAGDRPLPLRELRAAQCDYLTDEHLAGLLQRCPLLERVDLDLCDFVRSAGVSALAACPLLTRVSLCALDVEDGALAAVVRACPLLTELAAPFCDGVGDETGAALCLRPSLRALNLALSGVSDRSLRGARWPELRWLSLHGCELVGDAAVRAVAAHSPLLAAVDVGECVGVGDASLRLLLGGGAAELHTLYAARCPGVTESVARLAAGKLRRVCLAGCAAASAVEPGPQVEWWSSVDVSESPTAEMMMFT